MDNELPTRRGPKTKPHPKRHVLSQRYTDEERDLLERAAGGEPGAFIHEAAVRAASKAVRP